MTDASPFAAHFETNSVPLDHEIPGIKDYIATCKDKSAAIDAEIARLHSALDELNFKSNELRETINLHQGLISPLRRNLDILQEIFLHCLPTEHDSVISAREAPVVLSHVCRSWRQMALSTPRLWSSIYISVPNVFLSQNPSEMDHLSYEWTQERWVTILEAIDIWLSRSGTCPLSVTVFDPSEVAYYQDNRWISPILEKVMANSTRLQRLVVHGAEDLLSVLGDLNPSNLPLLEDLVVEISVPPWQTDAETIWERFGILSAPNIRRLCLRRFRRDPSMIPIVWAGLTHLSLESSHQYNANLDNSLEILRQCPRLFSLQIRIEMRKINIPQPPHPVFLPHLLLLSVIINDEDDIPLFFETLHAPSLRELIFLGSTLLVGINSLLKFLSQIQALRRFTFHPGCFDLQPLGKVLEACPHIVSLRSSLQFTDNAFWSTTRLPDSVWEGTMTEQDCQFGSALLKRLTPSDITDDDYLCPRLTSLEVKRGTFSPREFVNFVLARDRKAHNTGGQLPRFRKSRIEFKNHWDSSPLNQLPEDFTEVSFSFLSKGFNKKYGVRNGLDYQMKLYPRFSRTPAPKTPGYDHRLFYIDDETGENCL
ncbi:hypothetical protein CPB83DRAFT_844489 [Crepidotus variabilis]|uniref:F-box domain-containing protein n=1 Tax=Crepidotus variabilis TaxID=179855 RepID=A0A9P6JVT3_9AGAR|nr:hypothetical protein CPB83DRAFT_844489 [Crepidotus variabilis]